MGSKQDNGSRISKPSATEIRYEAMRIVQDISSGKAKDYDIGILNALRWVLGERKTLEKNDG